MEGKAGWRHRFRQVEDLVVTREGGSLSLLLREGIHQNVSNTFYLYLFLCVSFSSTSKFLLLSMHFCKPRNVDIMTPWNQDLIVSTCPFRSTLHPSPPDCHRQRGSSMVSGFPVGLAKGKHKSSEGGSGILEYSFLGLPPCRTFLSWSPQVLSVGLLFTILFLGSYNFSFLLRLGDLVCY